MHIRFFQPLAAVAMVGLSALLAGCSGPDYETAPVSGTVMVQGKPAANVFVQFEPANKPSDDIPSSTGMTDAEGNYSLDLSIPDGAPGAVIGEHVVRLAPGSGDTTTEGPAADTTPAVRLPEHATSGELRFTVPAEGAANADFSF